MTTKNIFSWSLLLLAGMGVSSCADKDVYDPNYKAEVYKTDWAAKFGTIDANQDWMMAKQITASLTADEDGTFYLYNGNPINKDANALLLAKCEAKAGQTTTITFDAPETISTIYVAHYKDGSLRAVPATIVDNKISVDMNPQETRGTMGDLAKAEFNAIKWLTKDIPASFDGYSQVAGHPNVYYTASGDATYTKIYYVTGEVSNCSFDANSDIYVCEGATLNEGIFALTSSRLYNLGTINADSVTLDNGSVILNDAVMTVKGGLGMLESSSNYSVQLWNDGTLEVGNFTQNSGSLVVNESGNVKVNNLTLFKTAKKTSATAECFNYAHWTTNNMVYVAGSATYTQGGQSVTAGSEWLNACLLTVNNLLTFYPVNAYTDTDADKDGTTWIDHAVLINDGGCLIKAKEVHFSHSAVTLCDNSLFKADKVVFGENSASEYISGMFGTAVLEFDSYEFETNGHAYFNGSYYGSVCVACDNLSSESTGFTWGSGSSQTAKTNAPVNIAISECNPEGYQSAAVAPSTKSQYFIFACEDLGSTGDYDFNDVVFSVGYTAGETEATVTALAAGGTLPATIYYDDLAVGEIHNMLGSSTTSTIINTTSITATSTTKTITVPSNFSISKNYSKFKVVVKDATTSTYITTPETGEAPMIIIVPDTWQWPTEKTSIKDAYPSFTNWAKDATATDWANSRAEGKTVTR